MDKQKTNAATCVICQCNICGNVFEWTDIKKENKGIRNVSPCCNGNISIIKQSRKNEEYLQKLSEQYSW